MVKELTHVFSHRKWFMKAFRGDLEFVNVANQITTQNNSSDKAFATSQTADLTHSTIDIGVIRQQLPKDWMLIKRSEFADYAWAGPHGKLTELCPIDSVIRT